ncbi:MAG: copper chaperone PCu(A)C [Rubrivivax sp.]|nr:copper chaperone PCu(A)C [Rubrivivax sp.]
MTGLVRRRVLLHAGIAMGAALVAPRVRACEYYASTLRITHPWTRASMPGDTSAVVCMLFDEVSQTDRLIGVDTPVAERAEMGGVGAAPRVDFVVAQGQVSELSEAGTYVRLVGLKQPLQIGRAYPLTLVFEKGGEVGATLNVDYLRSLGGAGRLGEALRSGQAPG